jgi:ketosteroid isomerase-like protein
MPTLTQPKARASTPEVPTTEADQQAVRGWLGSYSASINAGDIAAFARLWSDGCDWAPPDAPMLSGKQAILEHARADFQKYRIRHEFTDQGFKVGDGFAVALISSAERYTPKADAGVAFEQKVKGVVLLNRSADGSWAATHFLWNRDAPSPR